MALKFVRANAQNSVSVRAISGHPTGVTIPGAQGANRAARVNDPSTAQGRVLASSQPNTDRRRFVTHQ